MTNDSKGVHVGHLAHCFWTFASSSQRDYYLSFQLSVFEIRLKTRLRFDGVPHHASLLQGKVQFTGGFFGLMQTNLTMPVKRWGKEHLQVLDGGDPSESLTRNSLNLILAQVPGEKEMRKRKREILGFVWSHFTFRVLRKMDGSLERRASALKSETKLFYWP